MSRNALSYLILAAIVLAAIFVRIRLIDLPLERDEGEFALMGKLILAGVPPYQEAYNLKPPGIYLAYAAVMGVFGQSAAGVHAGLILVNLACAFLLFRITDSLFGRPPAALSASAFVALTLMPKVLGLSAHATHFVLLPALGGILLLVGESRSDPDAKRGSWRIFFAGLLMGVSVLMKQPGIFFALFGAFLLWQGMERDPGDRGRLIRRLGIYSAGFLLPVVAALSWLALAGVFERFWFWVVTYAIAYGSEVGLGDGVEAAVTVGWSIIAPSLVMWIVACLGIASLRGMSRSRKVFIVGFLVAAALAVAMGFHFRRHYFVLLLPAVSILFGLGIGWLESWLSAGRPFRGTAAVVAAAVALVAVGQAFASGMPVFASSSPAAASRVMFGGNPFVESEWIGERAAEMAGPGGSIAVLGSEPQIYFYADRPPATGYLYMYSVVENRPIAEKMRGEMIAEIEARRPLVLVYVNVPASWLIDESSDMSVFPWLERYVSRGGYVLEGVVEIVSPDRTVSLLGDEARAYTPVGKNFIQLWKRND